MNSLLIHGCFDLETAKLLNQLGARELALDLRGKSLNLVTYEELKNILPLLKTQRLFLKFQDESETMIRSYLDLLKNYRKDFTLIYTALPKEVDEKFFWFYSKESDYKTVFSNKNITGVILPLNEKEHFVDDRNFWELINEKKLETYLHGEEEILESFFGQKEVKLSFELSAGLQENYRKVDMDSLQKKKIWRILNENTSF